MNIFNAVSRRKRKSLRDVYADAASTIDAFIEGRSGNWDWDDFTSIKGDDPYLETVRLRCASVYDEFPADRDDRYCSDKGIEVLRELSRSLREKMKELASENSA